MDAGRSASPLTASLLLVAAATGGMVATAPLWAYAPVDPVGFGLSMAGGLGLVAAGTLGMRTPAGRPIARLVLVCATLYFLRFGRLAPVDLLYTMGLLVDGYWLVIAGHFIVAFPDGRLRSRLERGVVGLMYVWATLIRFVVPFVDQRDFGCLACPSNLLLVRSEPDVVLTVQVVDGAVATCVVALVVVVLIRRWRSSTSPERRVLNPVFGALSLMLAAAAVRYSTISLYSTGGVGADVLTAAIIAQEASILLLPAGLIVGQVRATLARASVANLLVRVGQGSSVPELERDIAWVLGDPSVRVTENEAAEQAHDVSTVASRSGPHLVIHHDPAVRTYQPELLEAVLAATRVALENRRLEADATLTRLVPPGLSERLQREGRRLGEIEELSISILISDIRGYSALAESADLRTLAMQLHRHRAAMNRAVAARGGVVMQFVGDAVFAIFGAPDPLEDHAAMAVRAAIDMQASQQSINREWSLAGLEPFRLGIGVTSGQVAAALLGSPEHIEYSVVGDVVNLAQRLQSMSDGHAVIIDEATFTELDGGFSARRLAPTTVKGRRAVVVAYRIEVPDTSASGV